VSVELRAAVPGDAAAVADVLLQSRKTFLPYARSPHTDDETRAWVRNTLLASQEVIVAVAQGDIVGVLAVDKSWIKQLYLDPAHVGRGIGSRLLEYALGRATRPIRLYCFQQNAGARRFYERHGFAPIAFGDGSGNEERCPDVLYELA
jgi:GNAT superfamily N-acetyltransferase